MGCFATVAALGAVVTLASGGDDRLTIGTEVPFPPYTSYSDAGELQGFDHDLMVEICARAAMKCEWQIVTFDELVPGVADGRFDLALGGMAITEERLKRVDFSTPYFSSDDLEWFVGPPGAPLPKAAEIAVQSGSLHETYLREEGLTLIPYPTEQLAVQAVIDGKADLAFGPFDGRPDLQPTFDANGLESLYSAEVPNLGTGIAVCKGNDALLTVLNDTISDMIEDGTLYDIEARWF